MKIPSGLHVDNPAWPLLQSLISYIGVTSANGNANGKTLVCADLDNEPSYDGLVVKLLSGNAAGQARVAQHHPASNTIVFGEPFTDNAGAAVQVVAGTRFAILTSMAGGGGPGPSPEEGLFYYGVVDAVPGANQFTISPLAGLGAGKFAGATNPYQAFVLRDAGGASAAPQGELQAITAYTTATGVFQTAAFTAAVAVGDEVLIIHPSIGVSVLSVPEVAETTAAPNIDESSALEQTLVTVTITARRRVGSIWMDMTNATRNMTIRVYHQIDGVNMRQFAQYAWTPADPDGILIDGFTVRDDFRVTLQCDGLGAGNVAVPYAIE